jgi:hypothetical protein
VDWSTAGARKREAGPTSKYHSIWLVERVLAAEGRLEDLAFSECAPGYPIDQQAVTLERTHAVQWIVAGPDDCGFPMRRRRTLAVALCRSTLVWVGPEQHAVQADFFQRFGRQCACGGEAYLRDTEEGIQQHMHAVARSRGVTLSARAGSAEQERLLYKLVPPGVVQRLGEHQAQAMAEPRRGVPPGAEGGLLCDLDHHVGRGPAQGWLWPVLLTHSHIWSHSLRRLATPQEAAAAMGLDSFTHDGLDGGRGESPVWRELKNFLPRQQLHMLGNAMHLPLMAAWMAYVFGNVARVADFYKLPPLVEEPSPSEADE